MKKVLVALVVGFSLVFAMAAFADNSLPGYKAGDAVYVCGCGEGCDCYTMARKAGKCSCKKDLVKGEVVKVDGDKVYVKVNGKEQVFPVKAKYACGCGEGCDCGTVSQKQGKCSCGKPLKEVK